MTAHLSQDTLLDLAYGELRERDATQAQGHVEACPECAKALGQIRGVRRVMAELPREEAPAVGRDSLMAYAAQAARRRVAGREPPARFGRIFAALAGLTAVAVVGVIAQQVLPQVDPAVFEARPLALPSAAPVAAAPEPEWHATPGSVASDSVANEGAPSGVAPSAAAPVTSQPAPDEPGAREKRVEEALGKLTGAAPDLTRRKGLAGDSFGGVVGLGGIGGHAEDKADRRQEESAEGGALALVGGGAKQGPMDARSAAGERSKDRESFDAVESKLGATREDERAAEPNAAPPPAASRANVVAGLAEGSSTPSEVNKVAAPTPPAQKSAAAPSMLRGRGAGGVPAGADDLEGLRDARPSVPVEAPMLAQNAASDELQKKSKPETKAKREAAPAKEASPGGPQTPPARLAQLRKQLETARGEAREPILDALCDAEFEAGEWLRAERTCTLLVREFPSSRNVTSAQRRMIGAQQNQQRMLDVTE